MTRKILLVVLLATTLFSVFLSCSKIADTASNSSHQPGKTAPNLTAVILYLRDSLTAPLLNSLDLTKPYVTTTDSGNTWYVRFPFRGYSVTQKFILIKTNSAYQPSEAACFRITRDTTAPATIPPALGFAGEVERIALNGATVYNSKVSNGYIRTLHNTIPTVEDAQQYVELPEIVIIADGPSYGVSYDLLIDGGSIGYAGFTGYTDASAGAGGSGSAASSIAATYAQAELSELQAASPAINIKAFLDCLASIADDAATTYTVSLMVRVPDPSNPDVMWAPLQSGGVGHTFLGISKANGSSSVTAYLGFYGQGGVVYSAATALGINVPSKIVNNSGHPYNASMTISLDETKFNLFISEMETNASNSYNLGSYNCTNYALACLNPVISTPLYPPSMAIPGQSPGETPNGLFKLLQSMPASGPDYQISISNASLTAGQGSCNSD